MILFGDSLYKLKELEANSVQCCVTSPPYWGLRDYGVDGQLGLEKTPEEYVQKMVELFREVRRVLKNDGTLWLNLGDSYASDRKGSGGKTAKQSTNKGSFYSDIKQKFEHGLKQKDLVGIPWRVAFALQADGWYLRQDIIWHKPNPMPESVRDRCTKAHEYIFLLSRSPKYYFDSDAIRTEPKPDNFRASKRIARPHKFEQIGIKNDFANFKQNPKGASKRSVWSVATKPFKGAHFATFPQDLIQPCILAGSKPGDTVLDPFFGAGTVGLVSKYHGRKFIGIELNKEYIEIAEKRIEAS